MMSMWWLWVCISLQYANSGLLFVAKIITSLPSTGCNYWPLIKEYGYKSVDRQGCWWNIYGVKVIIQVQGHHRVLTFVFLMMYRLNYLSVLGREVIGRNQKLHITWSIWITSHSLHNKCDIRYVEYHNTLQLATVLKISIRSDHFHPKHSHKSTHWPSRWNLA